MGIAAAHSNSTNEKYTKKKKNKKKILKKILSCHYNVCMYLWPYLDGPTVLLT